jgi:hypothetical protein
MNQPVQPLEVFDARVVQAPLQGLLRNMDGELSRRLRQAMASGDREAERRLSLLLIMLRLTKNAYEAIGFIVSDMDENPKRKKEFVLILPPTNRQLLDLLFTLVFIMDDFPSRSLDFELSGYRQGREEYDKFYERFGKEPKWQQHFRDLEELRQTMEKYLPITPEQKVNPAIIDYWRAPYKLLKKTSTSQPFLEFLEKWLYGETSAQAHLNAAGLFSVAGFLLSDFAPEEEREMFQGRKLEQFKFRHFSRTLSMVLGIASEIDNFCRLNNRATLSQLWVLLGGYSEEAMDLYSERYQKMLN